MRSADAGAEAPRVFSRTPGKSEERRTARDAAMGRELEQMAQKSIEAKTGDEKFKAELAGMQKKIRRHGTIQRGKKVIVNGESQQNLRDLKAESRRRGICCSCPSGESGAGDGQRWMDQLAALPQLKKPIRTGRPSADRASVRTSSNLSSTDWKSRLPASWTGGPCWMPSSFSSN